MAAVTGALRAIQQEDLVARSEALGALILPEIERIARDNCGDRVVEVRGRGLLIGIELAEAGLAGELLIELFNHGLVANHSMNGSATVRFTPPAILSHSDLEFLFHAVDRATRDLVARQARMPERGSRCDMHRWTR